MTLCLLIDRITDQAEFDLRDVHIPKVVDEIAPGVSERLSWLLRLIKARSSTSRFARDSPREGAGFGPSVPR